MVNLFGYGSVHSTNARPPIQPTIEESLPAAFDTPMFWSAEDLEQLRGTAILGQSAFQIVSLGC